MFQDMEPKMNQGSGIKEVPLPLQWPNEKIDYAKAFGELDRLKSEQFMYQSSPFSNTDAPVDASKVYLTEKFMEYELGIFQDMSPYDKIQAMRRGGPIPMSAFDRMENAQVRAHKNENPQDRVEKKY